MANQNRTIYFSGLNGLRAIAAISVLVAHVFLYDFANFDLPKIIHLPMAGYGVTLFFVISGFLITYLLLIEEKKTGRIKIRKFYYRRILRIWPLYYLFIVLCLITALFSNKLEDIFSVEIYWYLFFAANIPFITFQGILVLAHYWSIGVEEQFYLFWPWIVKMYRTRILFISVLIFLILFSVKSLSWFYLGNQSLLYRAISITRFHCMMIGAIGAILCFDFNSTFLKLVDNKYSQVTSWMVFFLMGFGTIRIPAPLGQEVIALVSLIIIIGQIQIKNRLINLENKIANFLGRISYGIYVIHPLVIFFVSRLFGRLVIDNIIIKYFLIYSIVIAVTIFISFISYRFFESPFLKWKTKFAVVDSSNIPVNK